MNNCVKPLKTWQTRHKIESGRKCGAKITIKSNSKKKGHPSHPRFSIMVPPQINTQGWNTANLSLYHSPWTTDRQNRFFSLQCWGPDKGSLFSVKYLGRPINVAFKGKFKATGTVEPALCIMFPSSNSNPDETTCRLVQPLNFVVLNSFDGYDPIEQKVVKKAKAVLVQQSGGWYKKVWKVYSKAVEPHEYKQPEPPSSVKAADPKKAEDKQKDKPPKDKGSGAGAFSDDSGSGGDEGDDERGGGKGEDEDTQEAGSDVDVGGPSPSPPAERLFFGGKVPKHLSSVKNCEDFQRSRLLILKKEERQANKQAYKQAQEKVLRRNMGENFASDDSVSDADSASEFEPDSDFEQTVISAAKEMLAKYTEPLRSPGRSTSTGSTSSGGGKFELCCSLFVFVCCNEFLCACRVRKKRQT